MAVAWFSFVSTAAFPDRASLGVLEPSDGPSPPGITSVLDASSKPTDLP